VQKPFFLHHHIQFLEMGRVGEVQLSSPTSLNMIINC
jgi:hypothetical protein